MFSYHLIFQATIAHLRERLECADFDVRKLMADKEREERLKEQVKVLTEQLLEAKRHHTPVRKNETECAFVIVQPPLTQEMHHFMALQTKIASLEQK